MEHGLISAKDGTKYEGEMIKGAKDGRGVQIYENGARYDGGWKNDKNHGFGRLINALGDVYLG